MLTNCATLFGLVFLFNSTFSLKNDTELSGKKKEEKSEAIGELLREIINEEKKVEETEDKVKLVRRGKSGNERNYNKADIFELSEIEAIEKARQTNAKKNKEFMKDAIVFPDEDGPTTAKSVEDSGVKIINPPLKTLIRTIKVKDVPRSNSTPVKNDRVLKEDNEKRTENKGRIDEDKASAITDENIKTLQSLLEEIKKERLLLEKAKKEKSTEETLKINEEISTKKKEDVVRDYTGMSSGKVLSQNEKALKSATVLAVTEKLTTPSTELLTKKTIQCEPTIAALDLLSEAQDLQRQGLHPASVFTHYSYHPQFELGFRQSKLHAKRDSVLQNEIKSKNKPLNENSTS